MKQLCYALILFSLLCVGCKENSTKQQNSTEANIKEEPNKIDLLIDSLTVDAAFKINDVRRYGLLPDEAIGAHPKTKRRVIDEIIRLASNGQKLTFPKGYFKTPLILSGKSNIDLTFNETAFAGGIIINGTQETPTKNIKLNGKLVTYSTFSCSYVDNVAVDSLIIRNDKTYSISKLESSGCNIYSGSLSLYINYLEIEGTGSDSDQFRFTPAALMIHGNSPKPHDILIKDVFIKSSDRHGAYLSGSFIEIEKMKIDAYGIGTIDNMIPIAYTSPGDEKKITGLWLNRFDDSNIKEVYINTANAKQAVDAIFLDVGDKTLPSTIYDLELLGNKNAIRRAETTNVLLN